MKSKITIFLIIIAILGLAFAFLKSEYLSNEATQKRLYGALVEFLSKHDKRFGLINASPFTKLEELSEESVLLSDSSSFAKSNFFKVHKEQLVKEMMDKHIRLEPIKVYHYMQKKYYDHLIHNSATPDHYPIAFHKEK